MKDALRKIAASFDLRDGFVFGGLALVVTGVALIYPPAAWIVGGVVFMYLGIR